MNVHILVTTRKPELQRVSTLVFDTIKTGFPTFNIKRHNNNGEWTHPEWIEYLIFTENEPFWICDTDIVFFESIESLTSDKPLMGRYEPNYYDPWLQMYHIQRLHTCLLRINPIECRNGINQWNKKFTSCVLQVPSLIKQEIIPTPSKPMLYDTCCKLYHVVGGQHFTEDQNNKFEHLHAGTYSDLVSGYGNLRDVHEQACINPQSIRGLRIEQERIYKELAI